MSDECCPRCGHRWPLDAGAGLLRKLRAERVDQCREPVGRDSDNMYPHPCGCRHPFHLAQGAPRRRAVRD